ncbi:MAG: hypothetical protein GXP41_11065 [Chloroflexi bacterium]|nr:hypothetical protein [Chloroflexota bacterium]
MTAKNVPMASLYLITALSISLAAIAMLSGVSPVSAIVRSAMAFVLFSLLGWVGFFALRTSEEAGTMGAESEENIMGTHVDVSIGTGDDELVASPVHAETAAQGQA